MIQQLLGAVQSYSEFEKDTQTKVTKLRNAVFRANQNQMNIIDNMSSHLVGRLFAVAENYPNLKAEQTVQNLLTAISDIEKEIADKRYYYNDLIMKYNTNCDIYPSCIYAWIFRFKRLNYLDFTGEENTRPTISVNKE
jgi:LemA protein